MNINCIVTSANGLGKGEVVSSILTGSTSFICSTHDSARRADRLKRAPMSLGRRTSLPAGSSHERTSLAICWPLVLVSVAF
jgi:hypothetical protein